MQSKIRFLYDANGNLARVITQETVQGEGGLVEAPAPENKLYARQVGTIEYYLSVAQENAWLNTDLVFMTFGRSDGKVAQRLMHYDHHAKAWTLVSNGWETDVEVAAGSTANLVVSFVHKRYSSLSPDRLAINQTTQQVALQVHPSAGYTPLNIENDVAADILEYCAVIQELQEEVFGDGDVRSRIDIAEDAIDVLEDRAEEIDAVLLQRDYIRKSDRTYVLFQATEGENTLHMATGNLTHTYADAGTYLIMIYGFSETGYFIDWNDGTVLEVTADILDLSSVDFTGFKVNGSEGATKYLAVCIGANCPVGHYSFQGCSNLKRVDFAPGWAHTSIGGFAFYNCTSLASVIIPDSVTTIMEEAFRGCTALMAISLPSGLTTLETNLFQDCKKLITVELPAGLTNVKAGAFRSCQSLMWIMLPSSVTSIGANAFKGCASLTNLIISVSITSIGAYAFDTTGLKKVTFVNSSSLPAIGAGAFYGQRNLEVVCRTESLLNSAIAAITTAGGLVMCGVYDGVRKYVSPPKAPAPQYDADVANKEYVDAGLDDKVSKVEGKGLSTNDLTDALKAAYDGAVSGLSNKVDKVTGKVLSDNNYTTAEKEKLAGLESSHFKGRYTSEAALYAAHPTGTYGDYAHVDEGAGKNTVVYIWDCTDEEWQIQQGASTEMTHAQIKEAYESNENTNAFTDDEKEKLAGIADNANNYTHPAAHPASMITEDSTHRFLTDVERDKLKATAILRQLGKYTQLCVLSGAGTYILRLVSGNVSHTYSAINTAYLITIRGYGEEAVCDWGDGTEETIDATGWFYFNNLDNQTLEIYLGSNCNSIGDYAFAGSLAQIIDISNASISMIAIGNHAFEDCKYITSIDIPLRIATIGEYAFSGCRQLHFVNFDVNSYLTTIGRMAFSSCDLRNIVLPASVTTIGSSAFASNSSLQSAVLNTAITSLATSIFKGCSSLVSVIFSRSSLAISSIESIGSEAFADCRSLTNISIPATVTTIGTYAFSNCVKLTTIEFKHTVSLPSMPAANNIFANCRISDIVCTTAALAQAAKTALIAAGATLLDGYRLMPGGTIKGSASVLTSAWTADTTYSGYGYRAAVTVSGLTANHTGVVNFNDAALALGIFKEGGKTHNGGFYIYASEIPASTISIESYVFWEV